MSSSSSSKNNDFDMEGNLHYSQLLDENDHKQCTEGNKSALLAETLAHLRNLTKELQQDDWMYQKSVGEKKR
jgi:hypothetical protein